ncbi:MAG: hypothetical protein GY750_11140 [Lentisphaerae bacterium]|nr:hypothetical protein [Lentisphaerota bacterium]MCP4101967.1 hypothetical protein [Lentisphaerota bacterium]
MIFKSSCNKSLIWSISLIAFIAFISAINCCGASSDKFRTGSGTLISFQRFDRSFYALLQYLKYTDRTVCHYLRLSAKNHKINCKIFVMNNKVDNDIIARGKDFYVMSELINALLYAKSGIFPNKAAHPLPAWLITGIYAKIQSHFLEESLLPVSYYPGLKALLLANKVPPLRQSLNTALSPSRDGIAFDLYMELCQFFIRELRRLSSSIDNPISDLVALSANQRYKPDEIFDSTVLRLIVKYYDKKFASSIAASSDYDKLDELFNYILKERLLNRMSPLTTTEFKPLFKKFRLVKYKIQKDKNVIVNKVDIVDFPRVYKDLQKDNYGKGLLAEKLIQLNALINIAPALTQEPLRKLYYKTNQFNRHSYRFKPHAACNAAGY